MALQKSEREFFTNAMQDDGIGIVGRAQASLAVDYYIKEFKTLSGLLLCYRISAYINN